MKSQLSHGVVSVDVKELLDALNYLKGHKRNVQVRVGFDGDRIVVADRQMSVSAKAVGYQSQTARKCSLRQLYVMASIATDIGQSDWHIDDTGIRMAQSLVRWF